MAFDDQQIAGRANRGICTLLLGILLISCPQAWAVDGVELPPVLLQMLRNDAVYAQLELAPTEIAKVTTVLDRVDGDWWRSRNMQEAQRNDAVATLTAAVKKELRAILSEKSFQRLEQLERQALGTRMLLLDDVASGLSLSPVTVNKIVGLIKESDRESAALAKRLQEGASGDEITAEQETLTKQTQAAVLGLLTNGQKQRISGLTGEPFDFSKVTRTLPRAPELVQTPERWLQGSPSTLADMRGKVVVVHFYAFQCINCQRNLPHYNAWYKDYADKGLVIIGIQSPETEAERDAAKVTAAIKSDGIAYPVLMDPESVNWQDWGTTMWPTLYVIDREGYLRTWWQGELNWQGNPGEKKVREQIERLLGETSR